MIAQANMLRASHNSCGPEIWTSPCNVETNELLDDKLSTLDNVAKFWKCD
jgi:hypothetical protein